MRKLHLTDGGGTTEAPHAHLVSLKISGSLLFTIPMQSLGFSSLTRQPSTDGAVVTLSGATLLRTKSLDKISIIQRRTKFKQLGLLCRNCDTFVFWHLCDRPWRLKTRCWHPSGRSLTNATSDAQQQCVLHLYVLLSRFTL